MSRLLVGLEMRIVVVMVAVMMVAGMNNHDNLRLRCIGYREAEDEHKSEQDLFHKLSVPPGKSKLRAALTDATRP